MNVAAHISPLELPDLTDITRFCRSEDIEPFLKTILAAVKSDQSRDVTGKDHSDNKLSAYSREKGSIIARIVWFYDDNSFEEYFPKR